MPVRSKLLIAGAALALGVAVSTVDPTLGGLLLTLAAFTTAVLWLQGFTRTPAFVRRARQAAAANPPAAGPPPDVPPREFKLQLGGAAVLGCYVAGVVPLAVGVYFFWAAANTPENRGPLAWLGFATALFGAVMLFYAYRATRRGVRVGPQGLEADQLVGVRRIAWHDVVAVASRTSALPRGGVINDHVVYGVDRSIMIPAKLAGRDELLAIIHTHAAGSSAEE